MRSFFISCPLYFELELIKEIEFFWHQLIDMDGLPTREPFPKIEKDQGGILMECPLHLGLQINFFTHIANRVLLRQAHFKARFFDQFEKELKKIDFFKLFDWGQVSPHLALEIESSKSRLFHEKNLTECFSNVLKSKKIKLDQDSLFRIYIRIVNDHVVLSLDTTGQHLHFRGYRKQQGSAPLRENLAALALQVSHLNTTEPLTLLDPFCGSGTLLFESALQNYPQFQRGYAFFNFKETPALFKSSTWKKNYKWITPYPRRLIGIEKDIETFKKNILNQEIIKDLFFPINCEVFNSDSFSMDLEKMKIQPTENLWIVTNPPYGERLASEHVIQILKRFESLPALKGLVVLHPSHWIFDFKNLKGSLSIPFSNQGLKIKLSVFKK